MQQAGTHYVRPGASLPAVLLPADPSRLPGATRTEWLGLADDRGVPLAATTVKGPTLAAMTGSCWPRPRQAGSASLSGGPRSSSAPGVAGYFGIDVTLVRVITAVVSVMGGAGVLACLAAWILIPAEGEPNSMAGVPVIEGLKAPSPLWSGPCSPPELL
jgi:phage shock protein PspC (stress-responsive transcriptional regulator)